MTTKKPVWYAIPVGSDGRFYGVDDDGHQNFPWDRYSGTDPRSAFLKAVMSSIDQASMVFKDGPHDYWSFDGIEAHVHWAVVPVWGDEYPDIRFESFTYDKKAEPKYAERSFGPGEFDFEDTSHPLTWDCYVISPVGDRVYGNLVTFHANSEV